MVEVLFFRVGVLLAGAGVALGAFGAHGLRARVTPDLLAVFEIGVRYQMYHALALLGISLAWTRWSNPHLTAAGYLFIAGIVVFSGSLYLLTITGTRWWGAVTPLGGVAFLAGWIALLLAART